MIEYITLAVLILAVLFLLTLFMGTVFQLILNVVLIVLLAIFIKLDIDKKGLLKYYVVSTLIAVTILIFPVFIPFIELLKKIFLVELTQALLIIYLLAHLLGYISPKISQCPPELFTNRGGSDQILWDSNYDCHVFK